MRLHNLVEAIMDSVTEAQNRIELQNIENILQYFDVTADGAFIPKKLELRMPYVELDQHGDPIEVQGENTAIQIPLLSLAQLTPVRIKDMSVKFDVTLGEVKKIAAPDASAPGQTPLAKLLKTRQSRKVMETELEGKSGFGRNKGRTAEVKITFESGELPEGYLKINSHLMKLF